MKQVLIVILFILTKSLFCQTAEIKIGDQVPDFEFKNIVRYPQGSLKLSDYKGKLVILDFWSTGCGPCIAGLPKMDSLQKHFGDKIRILPIMSLIRRDGGIVSDEGFKKMYVFIDSFWKSNPNTKNLTLSTIVDSIFYKRYPHFSKLLPLELWIDHNGTLIGQTDADHVNKKEIQNILDGKRPNWPVFKRYDYDSKPLLSPNVKTDPEKPYFYSTIFPYKEYLWPNYQVNIDTSAYTKRISIINFPILFLYQFAFSSDTSTPFLNRFAVNTVAKSKFYNIGEYREEWNMKHTYCYETVILSGTTDSQMKEKMRKDLDVYFNISSSEKSIQTKCYLLKRVKPLKTDVIQRAKGHKESISGLLSRLNNDFNVVKDFPIINKTGFKDSYEIFLTNSINKDPNNLSTINEALAISGLTLELATEKIKIYVLDDKVRN